MPFRPGRWLPAVLLSVVLGGASGLWLDESETEVRETGDTPTSDRSGSDLQGLKINIDGESEQTEGGKKRLVSGVFQNVQFDVGGGGKVELVLYQGTGNPPTERSIANYYHFVWNESGTDTYLWRDAEWNYSKNPKCKPLCPSPYIKPARGQRPSGSVLFFIGLDGIAAGGEWTLVGGIVGEPTPKVKETIQVDQFRLSITKSEPSIVFEIPPFTGSQNSSALPVRIDNDGNVPFSLTAVQHCPGIDVAANGTGLMHIGEYSRQMYVSVKITPRAPARIACYISVTATLPTGILVTGGAVTFEPAAEQPVDVLVLIARPGFNVVDCGAMVFQVKEHFTIKVAETVHLQMFASGRVTANLFWELAKPDYADVSEILLAGGPTGQPIVLPLSEVEGGELEIRMTIKPKIDNVDIDLKFLAQQQGGSARCEFKVKIVVLAEPDILGAVAASPVTLSIVGAAIVGTVAILIFAYVTAGRRRQMRIERIRESRRQRRRERLGIKSTLTDEEVQARREEVTQRRLRRRADRRRRKWLQQHDKVLASKGRRR